MILACSHLVVASGDVGRIAAFFERVFEVKPHFVHEEFAEFVLPSKFRVAFFRPVGKAAKYFRAEGARGAAGFGVTVADVDAFYVRLLDLPADEVGKIEVSGAPKEHPWGEKSFLFVDPDGNRWEVTQSPSPNGMLVNRP
jgi:uncharacterized glyoxalase superfamily protein PhnB